MTGCVLAREELAELARYWLCEAQEPKRHTRKYCLDRASLLATLSGDLRLVKNVSWAKAESGVSHG